MPDLQKDYIEYLNRKLSATLLDGFIQAELKITIQHEILTIKLIDRDKVEIWSYQYPLDKIDELSLPGIFIKLGLTSL
jgi:hypothetical protein